MNERELISVRIEAALAKRPPGDMMLRPYRGTPEDPFPRSWPLDLETVDQAEEMEPAAFIATISSGKMNQNAVPHLVRDPNPIPHARALWPMVIDLAGLVDDGLIPVLLNHDRRYAAGVAAWATTHQGRLVAAGVISSEHPAGRYLIGTYRRWAYWRSSIAAVYHPSDVEFIEEDSGPHIVNGRDFYGPFEIVRRWWLSEFSLVSDPADPESNFTLFDSMDFPTPPLVAFGLDKHDPVC